MHILVTLANQLAGFLCSASQVMGHCSKWNITDPIRQYHPVYLCKGRGGCSVELYIFWTVWNDLGDDFWMPQHCASSFEFLASNSIPAGEQDKKSAAAHSSAVEMVRWPSAIASARVPWCSTCCRRCFAPAWEFGNSQPPVALDQMPKDSPAKLAVRVWEQRSERGILVYFLNPLEQTYVKHTFWDIVKSVSLGLPAPTAMFFYVFWRILFARNKFFAFPPRETPTLWWPPTYIDKSKENNLI